MATNFLYHVIIFFFSFFVSSFANKHAPTYSIETIKTSEMMISLSLYAETSCQILDNCSKLLVFL